MKVLCETRGSLLCEFQVVVATATSEPMIVSQGGLLRNNEGNHYVYPGHSGFSLDFERYTGMAQIVAADLNVDGPGEVGMRNPGPLIG